QQIVDMTLNGKGVRDIVRVLSVSSATGINVLKKKEPAVKQVHARLLHTLDPPQVNVILRQVEHAEMDEMWSFVGRKSQQRWLWHAIDHHTGQILAYVFGTRGDETFLKLKALLAPFGITHFYTDGWGAYRRHIRRYLRNPQTVSIIEAIEILEISGQDPSNPQSFDQPKECRMDPQQLTIMAHKFQA